MGKCRGLAVSAPPPADEQAQTGTCCKGAVGRGCKEPAFAGGTRRRGSAGAKRPKGCAPRRAEGPGGAQPAGPQLSISAAPEISPVKVETAACASRIVTRMGRDALGRLGERKRVEPGPAGTRPDPLFPQAPATLKGRMALLYQPRPGCVVMCDFKGARDDQGSPRRGDRPQPQEPPAGDDRPALHHADSELIAPPIQISCRHLRARQAVRALLRKCDVVATVSLGRLLPMLLGWLTTHGASASPNSNK